MAKTDQERAVERKVAADKRRAEASAHLDRQKDHRVLNVLEADDAAAHAQPTPTQREVDLARLGCQVDVPEDDGSGPNVATKTVAASIPGGAGYQTRTVHAGGPGPSHSSDEDKKPETAKK